MYKIKSKHEILPIGFLLLILLLPICTYCQESFNHPTWKVLMITGAYTDGGAYIENWDLAREMLHKYLEKRKIKSENIRILSSHPDHIGSISRSIYIQTALKKNLSDALESLDLQDGDNLLLYITSHGGKNRGIYLEQEEKGNRYLSVMELKTLLDQHIKEVPSVILLSACYSGQFIQGELEDSPHYSGTDNLLASDRVILTAARNDRSSFGCGEGDGMPNWDESLIDSLNALEANGSWSDVQKLLLDRINTKEKTFREKSCSYPQAITDGEERNSLSSLFTEKEE